MCSFEINQILDSVRWTKYTRIHYEAMLIFFYLFDFIGL